MNLTHTLSCVALLSLVSACAGTGRPDAVSSFDERTGESLIHPALPLTLATAQPGLSAVGRDYLALCPVTVSGRGAPVTWIWLSLSSSIDRTITGAPEPDVRSIVLLVDGVPMTLDLEPWSAAAGTQPFGTVAADSYAARITNTQLQRIAGSGDLRALLVDPDTQTTEYALGTDTRASWDPVVTNLRLLAGRRD